MPPALQPASSQAASSLQPASSLPCAQQRTTQLFRTASINTTMMSLVLVCMRKMQMFMSMMSLDWYSYAWEKLVRLWESSQMQCETQNFANAAWQIVRNSRRLEQIVANVRCETSNSQCLTRKSQMSWHLCWLMLTNSLILSRNRTQILLLNILDIGVGTTVIAFLLVIRRSRLPFVVVKSPSSISSFCWVCNSATILSISAFTLVKTSGCAGIASNASFGWFVWLAAFWRTCAWLELETQRRPVPSKLLHSAHQGRQDPGHTGWWRSSFAISITSTTVDPGKKRLRNTWLLTPHQHTKCDWHNREHLNILPTRERDHKQNIIERWQNN